MHLHRIAGIGREKAAELNVSKTNRHTSLGMMVADKRMQLLLKQQINGTNIKIMDMYNSDRQPSGTRVEIVFPYEKE